MWLGKVMRRLGECLYVPCLARPAVANRSRLYPFMTLTHSIASLPTLSMNTHHVLHWIAMLNVFCT